MRLRGQPKGQEASDGLGGQPADLGGQSEGLEVIEGLGGHPEGLEAS